MPNLPASCSNHSAFSGGIGPFKAGQCLGVFFSPPQIYSYNSYARKRLIGIRESFHPHVPKFPYQTGESQSGGGGVGASSLEEVEGGGGGLELGDQSPTCFPFLPTL